MLFIYFFIYSYLSLLYLIIFLVNSNSSTIRLKVSQMSYSLVVILELSGVSEVQYKEIMIIDDK